MNVRTVLCKYHLKNLVYFNNVLLCWGRSFRSNKKTSHCEKLTCRHGTTMSHAVFINIICVQSATRWVKFALTTTLGGLKMCQYIKIVFFFIYMEVVIKTWTSIKKHEMEFKNICNINCVSNLNAFKDSFTDGKKWKAFVETVFIDILSLFCYRQ